jgi:tetratricopeptide (TPR) repeat protein
VARSRRCGNNTEIADTGRPGNLGGPDFTFQGKRPMNLWQRILAGGALVALAATFSPTARASGNGQADLDEALRVKITAEGLQELNQVIELLESALDKGLDLENSNFAEQVLSESLLERALQLTQVVDNVPEENLGDRRIQRVRALATSDLRRVLMYDNPPAQATAALAKLLAMPGGDEREARGMLDKLIDSESFAALPPAEQAEAYGLRARIQRDAEKALADFARAIELDNDNVDYRLDKARFQFEHDQVDEALAEVAGIVEKTPDQVSAYLLQVQILRALNRYDEALKSLDKVDELAQGSIVPHEYRGEIYREMGEFDKAIDEFTRVLQIQPGMDLALIRRAEAYMLAERLDEALADINAVLKNNPDLALAHGLRAQVLASQEKFGDAIAEMKLLADEMPGQPDVRMQLALYYLLNNETREAIAQYTQVLDLDAEHFLALRGRGDAYLNLGDHAAAVEDFKRALAVEPEDSALLNNFAWVLATSPDDNIRDGEQAIELATKACEITDYKTPHILSTLAAAYAENGDFDTARKWSKQAVDMDDKEHDEQLRKELASYEENKPWRERQTPDEDGGKEDAASNEDGAVEPAAASTQTDDEPAQDASAEETPAEESSDVDQSSADDQDAERSADEPAEAEQR